MSYDNEKHVFEREFHKLFTLSTGWPLPNVKDMFTESLWESDGFQRLKTVLNGTKHKLNSFDLDRWHEHTTRMNPAGLVVGHIKKHVRPDLLTQAWCKFYEIVCSQPDLVPRDAIDENHAFTVHLCEAPGAFVSALNHYVAINHEGLRLKWLAMTLNPYHEANGHPDAVTDDRLIRDTLDNWEFGPDYTGDIFQAGYSEHLYRRTALSAKRSADGGRCAGGGGGGVCLVTADGSVDCSDDPGEQENVVMRLHDYETMVALNVLRDGGSLVLKMFTMFECNTICRMYLLCCLFRSVAVRKPMTSKPGNSEVYAVCVGYRGRSLALPFVREFFASRNDLLKNNGAMFPASQVPGDFRAELLECAGYFSRQQIQTIESNIAALSHKDRRYREMEATQRALCREFIVKCGLRPIRYDQVLLSVRGSRRRYRPGGGTCNGRRGGTSYAEKTRLRHAPDLGREADVLYRQVKTHCDDELRRWRGNHHRYRADGIAYWGERENLTVGPSDVRFRLGKPVTVVRGSKFCSEPLIRCRVHALSKFPPPPSVEYHRTSDVDSRSLYYRFKFDRPRMVVCDLTDVDATDNVVQQHRCLVAVVDALRSLTAGDDLALVGYPLYTQTAVACFFAVAAMFATHCLTRPDDQYGHAFVFCNYENHDGWLDVLNAAERLASPDANVDGRSALVSWLPINVLLEQRAYAAIVSVNDLCIVREVQLVITSFLNPVSL